VEIKLRGGSLQFVKSDGAVAEVMKLLEGGAAESTVAPA
jgi:hypothetical protein